MQDVRIRTGTAALLSFAAFTSILGAGVVFLWWLLFAHPLQLVKKMRVILPVILLIVFFGIVLELSGGGGTSYCLRMVVVVLIGTWLFSGYRTGDFLHLGTWLFGERSGFELGMTAEMGMQAVRLLAADLDRIKRAQELKGLHWGIRSLVPAGMILVRDALRRADESAELLAVRGYVHGGTFRPVFITPKGDIIAGLAALCMGIISFIPVSEFFILYH
jgi:hypothetical protein